MWSRKQGTIPEWFCAHWQYQFKENDMIWNFSFGTFLLVLALLAFASIRILREYDRGVVFMLGRFWKVKGPGLVLIIPGIQQMVKVGLRTVVMDVPSQD